MSTSVLLMWFYVKDITMTFLVIPIYVKISIINVVLSEIHHNDFSCKFLFMSKSALLIGFYVNDIMLMSYFNLIVNISIADVVLCE